MKSAFVHLVGRSYRALTPLIVDTLGFGFQSVGTVTNGAYEGNPYPRIKRLVKSRTMLVYKGFKSTGMSAVLRRIKGQAWRVPVGISIGRTNMLHGVSFYEPERLAELLTAVCALNLPKPLFIKMPIGLGDDVVKALLDVVMRFPVAAEKRITTS